MKKKSNVHRFLTGSVTAALVASAVAPAVSAAETEVNFKDISNLDTEAQSAITSLAEAGVVKGYENGTKFDPWQNVKRGQVALMLTRIADLGLDSAADTDTDFTDLTNDTELIGAVEALVNAGVAKGYENNTFKPFENMSRQHMAKLLVNAFELELNEDSNVNITDLDEATDEMKPYIEILASHGITTQTEFRPNEPVSRYAFSLFLQRAIETVDVEAPIEETVNSGIAGFIFDGASKVKNATVTVGDETTTTDENGYFELLNVQPGKQQVTVKADGFKTVTTSDVIVLEDEVSSFTKDIASSKINTSNIAVDGMVVNSDTGAAINGATVKLETYNNDTKAWELVATVNTNAAGKYTINQTAASSNLKLGAEYRQTVSLAGHKDFVQTITLDNENVVNTLAGIKLDEIAAMDITGTITDAAGAKVSGATVTIYDADGTAVGNDLTDANGVYELTGKLLLSGTYNVVVDHNASAYSYTEFQVVEGTNATHNVQLEAGYTIDAKIGAESLSDVFGKASSDADTADYKLELLNKNTVIADDTVTGGSGADEATLDFDFARVAPGTYTLKLSGDYVKTQEYTITVDGNETFEGRAVPAGKLTGVVQKSIDSSALAGANVSLLDSSDKVIATAETNAQGAYTFAGLTAGKYKVKASADNFVDGALSGEVTIQKNDAEAASTIQLNAVATQGNVSGTARIAGTLAAPSSATVTYYDADGEEVKKATVQADGSYSLSNLAAGTYEVVVRGTDFETYTATQTIVAGENLTKVNYSLTAGADASLKVKVVDSEGNPVNVTINGFDLADAYVDPTSPTVGAWEQAATAVDNVTFSNLSAGTYNLKIDVASAEFVDKDVTVSVAKGEAQELVITVDKVAAQRDVNFRVIDEANTNVSGAYVVIFNEDGTINGIQQTDAQGTYALKLVDGNYTMAIIKDGYVVNVNELTVAGKTVTLPVIQLSKLN